MRIKRISTSMGIAISILIAGFTVQITDNLEIFGKNSYLFRWLTLVKTKLILLFTFVFLFPDIPF